MFQTIDNSALIIEDILQECFIFLPSDLIAHLIALMFNAYIMELTYETVME